MIAFLKKSWEALAGIAVLILGIIFLKKGSNKDTLSAKESKAVADDHMQQSEHKKTDAKDSQEEANTIHDDSIELADDITQPKEPVKLGRTRRTFSSS